MDGTVYLMDVRHSMVIFGFSLDHNRDMYCRPPSPIPHRHIPPAGHLPPLKTPNPPQRTNRVAGGRAYASSTVKAGAQRVTCCGEECGHTHQHAAGDDEFENLREEWHGGGVVLVLAALLGQLHEDAAGGGEYRQQHSAHGLLPQRGTPASAVATPLG